VQELATAKALPGKNITVNIIAEATGLMPKEVAKLPGNGLPAAGRPVINSYS